MANYNNYKQEEKKKTAHIKEELSLIKKDYVRKSFNELKPVFREYAEFWLSYPDYFVDFLLPEGSTFQLFYFQRIFLRVFFRYRKVFITATRGTSKTFTEILANYLLCVMRPNIKKFIVAPGKQQASKIAQEKIRDIWKFIPILKNEVEKFEFQKDYTRLFFRNGSVFDVVQASDAERGGRRNGGSIEEIVDEKLKPDVLNEVVIPLMAGNRPNAFSNSKSDPYEVHKQEWYMTTAGVRQSYAYNKMMELYGDMFTGKDAFVYGAGYELAVEFGNLDIDFIEEKRSSKTYNFLSFSREYMSEWTGSSENSLVDVDALESNRILKTAELEPLKSKDNKGWEYILSYDVARAEGKQNANSALIVLKIKDRGNGKFLKHVVNIYSFEGSHFKEQALFLKEIFYKYNARVLIIDNNGLGKGVTDELISDIDENPRFSVINDDSYKKYETSDCIPALFLVSSNKKDTDASDIHEVFMRTIKNNEVKFLVSSSSAKDGILEKTKNDSEKFADMIYPYAMTDVMVDEIMNLEYKTNGRKISVKQISSGVQKDKFSALEYGLFWVYLEEQKLKIKTQQFNWKDYFFN